MEIFFEMHYFMSISTICNHENINVFKGLFFNKIFMTENELFGTY